MISQGQHLETFEQDFAAAVGTNFAVAFSSGTAALHAMCVVSGLGEGDMVMMPALTFAGTANAVLLAGAEPLFVDIEPETFCLSLASLEQKINHSCRAILSVDFAGLPVEYDALRTIADERGLLLLSDSAHAPGARYRDRPVGSLADMSAFSFNPVKNMTCAEGGMVTTDRQDEAEELRMFRVHGMTRAKGRLRNPFPGDWYYEQQFLGLNYKLSEPHAALGCSQLAKLSRYNKRRQEIATIYRRELAGLPILLPGERNTGEHVYHLFIVRVQKGAPISRDVLFLKLRDEGIGVQIHYIPIPMHPYYEDLGYGMEGLEHTVRYYSEALSIPIHPAMQSEDVNRVVAALGRYLS